MLESKDGKRCPVCHREVVALLVHGVCQECWDRHSWVLRAAIRVVEEDRALYRGWLASFRSLIKLKKRDGRHGLWKWPKIKRPRV